MSLAGKCQLRELVLKAEAAEVELWAAAQAVVLVGFTSGALHSQSIWCCHQGWDPKGAIQGTYFLERELLGQPKLSVQVWWCSTCVCAVEKWLTRSSWDRKLLPTAKEEAKFWWHWLKKQHFTHCTLYTCPYQLINTKKNWGKEWIVVVQWSSVL